MQKRTASLAAGSAVRISLLPVSRHGPGGRERARKQRGSEGTLVVAASRAASRAAMVEAMTEEAMEQLAIRLLHKFGAECRGNPACLAEQISMVARQPCTREAYMVLMPGITGSQHLQAAEVQLLGASNIRGIAGNADGSVVSLQFRVPNPWQPYRSKVVRREFDLREMYEGRVAVTV